MGINALSWEIPPRAAGLVELTFFEGEGPDDPVAKLHQLAASEGHVILEPIRRGGAATPGAFRLWAYTREA